MKNIKIIMIGVITLFFINCNYKTTKITIDKTDNIDSIVLDESKNKLANDEGNIKGLNFESFLDSFNNDSIFQLSRVRFPIKVTEIDYEDENYPTIEIIINQNDYVLIDLKEEEDSETREFDKYTQKTVFEKNKAIIQIRGIDNGIHCDYEFEKVEGKWMLTTWRNRSM